MRPVARGFRVSKDVCDMISSAYTELKTEHTRCRENVPRSEYDAPKAIHNSCPPQSKSGRFGTPSRSSQPRSGGRFVSPSPGTTSDQDMSGPSNANSGGVSSPMAPPPVPATMVGPLGT